VGIGASAGGLAAFKAFFQAMPPDAGAAFVLISHLDPDHQSLLSEIVGRHSAMQSAPVHRPLAVAPNRIYVLPPNRNLVLADDLLVPEPIPPDTGVNLPVDRFFGSLAAGRKERAIGVILSGAMSDGALGLREIKAGGGLVIAQRPDTAQYAGMPKSAVETGMVDWVLPVAEMPGAILRFLEHPYVKLPAPPEWRRGELESVLSLVRSRSGMDFGGYKRHTLLRRTQRRMGLRQIAQLGEYAELLTNDPGEAEALRKDLLIGVTAFFREPDVWNALEREILPALIQKRRPGEGPRVWVPGCSSGEEAYGFAMLFQEAYARLGRPVEARIFATDVEPGAIALARRGLYPLGLAAPIPAGRLNAHFLREPGGYRVRPEVREPVLFAVHNLLADPPFSGLDLISCRNLLIYLTSDAQNAVMERFRFSLRPGGILVLGRSEVVHASFGGFEPMHPHHRIFRASGRGTARRTAAMPAFATPSAAETPGRKRPSGPVNRGGLMHRLLLERFAPAAALINSRLQILHLHGPTRRFLDLPQGQPVLDLSAMLPEEARGRLGAAVREALRTGRETSVSGVRYREGEEPAAMGFTVGPVPESDSGLGESDPLLLVAFHSEEPADAAPEGPPRPEEADRAAELEEELRHSRAERRGLLEELKSANADLTASNEEMLFVNENLQAANEELETSHEELQSMNEELQTVNAELLDKIQQLENAHNDLANLMDSTEIATLFLDRDAAIRRYTPAAKELFRLTPTDVGRPIGDLTMRFHDPELKTDAQGVLERREPVAREVWTGEGRWFIRRLLPFRTMDNRMEGLVLTFGDVTELKKTEGALRDSEAKFRFLAENAPDVIVRFDREFRHVYVNPVIEEITGIPRDDFIGRTNRELGMPEELCRLWEAEFEQAFETGKPRQFEFEFPGPDGPRFFEIRVVPEILEEGEIPSLLAVTRDVTQRKQMEADLAASERKFRNVAENIPGLALKFQLFPDGRDALQYISKGVEALLEIPWEEASEDVQKLWDRVHPDDREDVRASVTASAERLFPWENEHRVQMTDGRIKWVYARGTPTLMEDGSVVWDTLAVDITERKRAEERLRKSRAMLARTQEIAHVGSWKWEIDGDRVTWSEELFRIFGMDPEETPPSWAGHAVLYPPEDMARLRAAVETSRGTGEPFEIELRPLRRDGEIRYAHSRGFPEKDSDGRIVGFYGFLQDITDLKRSEADLRRALEEKEVLLREIHHRVKNNMQVISGLLRMHARMSDDADLRGIFEDCRNRVSAMALIHEALYEARDVAQVDFEVYLSKLCRNLSRVYGASGRGIEVRVDGCNISLSLDQGVAVGMVVSELVSNAFKHAFPLEKGGRVTVELTSPDANAAELIVADNGKGLPPEVDLGQPSSLGLGLELATDAVRRELGGTISVSQDRGARYAIRFQTKEES
jgi:PAS domain S-box-containing protein